MIGQRAGLWIALACGLIGLGPPAAAEDRGTAETIRVGMVHSLCKYVPDSMAELVTQPFSLLMRSQTGLNGEIVDAGDPNRVAGQLSEDRIHLGIFFGIEYAWIREKHPELRPLMIAVNHSQHLRAHLIVRADSKIGDIRDLKGKAVALPHQSREHCHVFLERRCLKSGASVQKHCAKLTTPANAEDALDDVVEGVVQAAVIDGPALDCFKRRKPGRFAQLKIAQTSEIFPASVVVYRPGSLNAATLERFRAGMLNANKSSLGRELLNLSRLTGFEAVPADYEKTLADIVKIYPPPKAGAAK